MGTRAELRTAIRQRADMENTTFVADTEINEFLAQSLLELQDFLATVYGADFIYTTDTISTVAGTSAYSLPADFLRLNRVSIVFDSIAYPFRRLESASVNQVIDVSQQQWTAATDLQYRITPDSIAFLPIPAAIYTVDLDYVPRMAMAADSTPNPLGGYDEYLVLDGAIKCLTKEQSDTGPLMLQKQALQQRIMRDAPPMDRGNPPMIRDVRNVYWFEGWCDG